MESIRLYDWLLLGCSVASGLLVNYHSAEKVHTFFPGATQLPHKRSYSPVVSTLDLQPANVTKLRHQKAEVAEMFAKGSGTAEHFNMEPEKGSLMDYRPLEGALFQGSMLVWGECRALASVLAPGSPVRG